MRPTPCRTTTRTKLRHRLSVGIAAECGRFPQTQTHPRQPTDHLAQPKAREVRNYHQEMHVVYASAQPMPKVVAFAGKIGSGKTTITKSLADLLAWPRASFGDYVREAARQRGMKDTREVLQVLGTEILRADPRNFCQSVLAHCGWNAGQNLLIDGLRHEETIEIIKGLTHATTVSIVFVKISEEVRLERLMGGKGATLNTVRWLKRIRLKPKSLRSSRAKPTSPLTMTGHWKPPFRQFHSGSTPSASELESCIEMVANHVFQKSFNSFYCDIRLQSVDKRGRNSGSKLTARGWTHNIARHGSRMPKHKVSPDQNVLVFPGPEPGVGSRDRSTSPAFGFP